MASIDGEWDVTARGPGVAQTVRVRLRSSGSEVSGEVVDGAETYPLSGGVLEGDRLSFRMSIERPIHANLAATLTVDGDRMTGTARAGLLLRVGLEATRVG